MQQAQEKMKQANFNSFMVRLKAVKDLVVVITPSTFQFLYGAIKSISAEKFNP